MIFLPLADSTGIVMLFHQKKMDVKDGLDFLKNVCVDIKEGVLTGGNVKMRIQKCSKFSA